VPYVATVGIPLARQNAVREAARKADVVKVVASL
jgi:hypothetical protein